MRIYCNLCDKVQPAQVDDCKDVKTGELYQDIVCGECGLVITSGTGIKRPWVGLTDEDKKEVVTSAENALWADVDLKWRDALMEFTEAKLREKNT